MEGRLRTAENEAKTQDIRNNREQWGKFPEACFRRQAAYIRDFTSHESVQKLFQTGSGPGPSSRLKGSSSGVSKRASRAPFRVPTMVVGAFLGAFLGDFEAIEAGKVPPGFFRKYMKVPPGFFRKYKNPVLFCFLMKYNYYKEK